MLMDEVKANEIEVLYNAKVIDYTGDDDKGGVILADGRRISADVVVAGTAFLLAHEG
jgi:NAD(P)H-nitrite reductase large subunit